MADDAPHFPLSRRGFLAGVAGATLLAATARGEVPPMPGLDEVSPDDLPAMRRYFGLAPGLTYLNNGSLGPSPGFVLERARAAWERLETNPVREGYGPLLADAEAVRRRAARFLGVGDELAITRNTTEAMNLLAQGAELQTGDHVLTTDQEHPGGFLCWAYYAKRRGVVIDRVALPDDDGALLAAFAAAFTERTRVVSVSHVTYTTGRRLPIAALAALAHGHGALLVVDGAQAPGALAVDVGALGCDAYATSAHKWLLAPKGTGLLVIRAAARQRLDPLPLSQGMRVYTGATGERNLPGIVGLGAAIELFERLGPARVEAHNLALRQRLIDRLAGLPKLPLASPADPALGAPLVTFALPAGVRAAALQQQLAKEHRVEVRAISHGGLNGLRVSLHLYNGPDDIDHLIAALKHELGG